MFDPVTLPLIFASLMGLSILLYVVLDGFDLGVGLLFPFASEPERDRMIASIGPFWDANETWLVLAIGLLLVAFPAAHGAILTALYLPVAVMLIGLILRGVAFEFRAKAPVAHKRPWDAAFWAGSLMTALSQGFMLGLYIMGLRWGWAEIAFASLTAVALAVAYSFIGAAWTILKTDGDLQIKAVSWARGGIWGVVLGMGAVSVATPLVSARIFDKWFRFPEIVALAPLPMMSGLLVALLWLSLRRLPTRDDSFAWFPFAGAVTLMVLGFFGMAYSFYPYIVPDKLTIWQAASSTEALTIILIGTLFVLPVILCYTVLAYVIFRGKATKLSYG
ncbi:cytochrome d ubiquinol oxidase subunit II [Paragemmobacter straminiformis]|uniref:Cytochrome d ubiquinol oxidase subunit II n=1 Tax=Paragemmobacter straminiformis TaxID=2045119 RepID=A0A842IA73_9RHOB|nr:cytochrome d ubiquinol oxidase subunit II [Gemmobacter straminiformis]MBC2836760.1 cytochrome d ubiquinol oxidase subunit II [Gemmobacter straminiformis]